jgi:phenylalanine-4-hydroxylase
LFEKRRAELSNIASGAFTQGLAALMLDESRIPELTDLSARVNALYGWSVMPVRGFLPSRVFFGCLSRKLFPSTSYIRDKHCLDYTPEPDIFHDVFGHLPMFWHPQYRDFVHHIGQLAPYLVTDQQLELLSRVYWFTVEFGLVQERSSIHVYGSGLISSFADCQIALGPYCDRKPFNLDEVLAQPVESDQLQKVLFFLDSFDQLGSISHELEQRFLR